MRYLVDSDWLADYLKGRAPARRLLDSLFPDGLAISIITYAEIYQGIYYGTERRRTRRASGRCCGLCPSFRSRTPSRGAMPPFAARSSTKVSSSTTQTYPNTTTAAFSYDAADNLAQIIDSQAGNPVWTFGYTRDAYHQLATASDPIEAKTHTYSYDALNRLTSDQGGSISGSWTLNAGDEVTKTQTAITQSYDAASELTGTQPRTPDTTCPITSKPRSSTYSYNANGDRTQQTDTACGTVVASNGYDQADQLISLAQGSTNATYAYNGDGLRMSKTVNGTAEAFSWDLAEGMPLILQDGSTKYLTGPGGLPIEQVAGSGTVLYSYQDQLGSTRGLRDAAGNVAATFTYSAYGHQVGFSSNGSTTPFGFAGQYTDAESGFQYLRNRYYDPSTTQFLTVDPLVASTGEPYSYVGDNPINWIDPMGLCKAGFVNVPFGGSGNCSDAAGAGAYNALPAVHKASTAVAIGASVCAAALAVTTVGAAPCTAVAAGAATVTAATGVALYFHGRQSGTTTAIDVAGMGVAGAAGMGEVGANAAESAAETAGEASAARFDQMAKAQWYAKGGPWVAGQWFALKHAMWNATASALTGVAMGFDLAGAGSGVYGLACG